METLKKLFKKASFKDQVVFLEWMDSFLYEASTMRRFKDELTDGFHKLSEKDQFKFYDWVVEFMNPPDKE